MKRQTLVTVIAGMLGASAIAGGLAWAAIPGAGGVINGCYHRSEGMLRVIDSTRQGCRDSEVPIAWNQTGPQGPHGDEGSPGTDGAPGKDGVSVMSNAEPAGANCAVGGVRLAAVNGVNYACNGRDGRDGVDGHDGVNGASGPAGPSGVAGVEYVVAHGVATQGGKFGRFPLEARCSAGKKVLGGGFGSPGLFEAITDELAVFSSKPSLDHGGWYIFVTNLVTLARDEPFDAWAICASV
jgi:hypothetical protein